MTSLSRGASNSRYDYVIDIIGSYILARAVKSINSYRADASFLCFNFSAYLINGKVKDVVFRSDYRMWCTHLAVTETTAVASSVSETAVENSSDLAGERAYCMSRGDCRWWTMSNRTRNWSSAWSWVTRQSERPDWSAPGPVTSTCHCHSSWLLTCPRFGLSINIESTRMWVRLRLITIPSALLST